MLQTICHLLIRFEGFRLERPSPAGLLTPVEESAFHGAHNNVSERALRVVALGRKNSLFVGPGDCGQTYATLMTVVHTCRLHDIDVEAYLTDVLPRLATLLDAPTTHPGLEEAHRQLTPRAWQRDRQQQGTPVV